MKMDFVVVMYFLICGGITSLVISGLIKLMDRFIELSNRLSTLIEVTYCATHDPDFKPEFAEKTDTIQ